MANRVLDAIIVLIENLINIFDLSRFFTVSDNDWSSEIHTGHLFNMLNLFKLLADFSIPILGVDFASQVIGGMTLTFSALSMIFSYIKPAPRALPRAENWTLAIENGNLNPLKGRREVLNQMASILKPNSIRPHVLLLGESGVGKTETAKAFAKAVLQGDYPTLANKQVFYIKTPDLIKPELGSASNSTLNKLKKAMGHHRENIILVFDEIHVACQPREHIDLCNELKTLLNPDGENFPCVIGITTEEEYKEHIQPNTAFDRRFHQVYLGNTSKEETLSSLYSSVVRNPNGVLLENEGTLHHLLNQISQQMGEDSVMPLTALTVLDQCVGETLHVPKTETKKQAEELHKELSAKYFGNYSKEKRDSTAEMEERLSLQIGRAHV